MAVESLPIERLQRALRGPVLAPDDPGYDVARRTFNALTDRRPVVIACCAGTDDVAAAVDFASRAGLPVAIRGGGHSVAGHSVCEGGLVVDLRLMHQVRVDPESRRVRVGGGANWRDVDAPCAAHGLAMPGGTYDTTGVAGLTLGGGIGHLMGTHGLTLDNLDRLTPSARCVHRTDAGLSASSLGTVVGATVSGVDVSQTRVQRLTERREDDPVL